MFALLSASYMLSLLVADPCISEVYNVPGKNETVAHKCFPPMVKGQVQDDPLNTITEAAAKQKNPYKKSSNND
jgi:hypothetical protein